MAEDNHYVPIFYQKRWAIRPDRRVCVYSRPYKDARVQRKHPKGVGYQPDLYTVTNTDAAVATYLERQFFKVTDDLAAKALSVIEAGQWPDGYVHPQRMDAIHHVTTTSQPRTGWKLSSDRF